MLPLPCITFAIANRVPREMKYSRSFFKSLLFLYFSQFLSSVYFFWPYIPYIVTNTVLFHHEKKILAATCRSPIMAVANSAPRFRERNKKIEKSLHRLRARNSIYTCNSTVCVSTIKNGSLFPSAKKSLNLYP